MKKQILTAVACVFSLALTAQKQVHKYRVSSINQIGLLAGSGGDAVQIQTINGVVINKSFAGIGLGLDSYADRTIPLFLHLQHQFLKKNHSPIVYASGGFGFPFLSFIQKEQIGMPDLKTAPMYDLGVGWKFFIKENRGLLLTAGHSFKQVKGYREYTDFTISPLGTQRSETIEKNYGRISIKVGWQF